MDYDYRTWIEISRSALAHNCKLFRKIIGQDKLFLAVVKSNAYGHGLLDFGKQAAKYADFLGVDSITEAFSLRRAGIRKPILVLGYTLPKYFSSARKQNISITISSKESLAALLKMSRPPKIHLKFDSGMHRQGFLPEEIQAILEKIKARTQITLEGFYSHFADASNQEGTAKQYAEFQRARQEVLKLGFTPIFQLASSTGVFTSNKYHFDMVRVGFAMYGLWPSDSYQQKYSKKYPLRPVLSWKTFISEIKALKNGETVGYNFSERLKRDSKIAILPVGYWHGFTRLLSGKASVLVGGRQARVLGLISMDMIAIDVTDIKNVRAGQEVVLIGQQGKYQNRVEDLAALAGMHRYELVSRLNPLIKKFLVK